MAECRVARRRRHRRGHRGGCWRRRRRRPRRRRARRRLGRLGARHSRLRTRPSNPHLPNKKKNCRKKKGRIGLQGYRACHLQLVDRVGVSECPGHSDDAEMACGGGAIERTERRVALFFSFRHMPTGGNGPRGLRMGPATGRPFGHNYVDHNYIVMAEGATEGSARA